MALGMRLESALLSVLKSWIQDFIKQKLKTLIL